MTQHDPSVTAWPEEHRVVVRCGGCGNRRVLADVWVSEESFRIGDVNSSRPHIVVTSAGHYDGPTGGFYEPTRRGERFVFACHPKCGARPVVRYERLRRLAEEALASGHDVTLR